jgi:uncharacterized membrane protein (DUF106 family)
VWGGIKVFETLLNPVLEPLLKLQPFYAILILSFVISLFITLIYKFFTDQDKMRALKDDMKRHQKEMKEHKHDPQKVMAIQKKAMQKNMEYMKHSFKPTLITFIPILIIFGWMNVHLGYYPILPGQTFNVTAHFNENAAGNITLKVPQDITLLSPATQPVSSEVVWSLNGRAGEYILEFDYNGLEVELPVLITTTQEYRRPIKAVNKQGLKKIEVGLAKIHPFGNFSFFGWHPGWLGTYIIFSLIFSMSLRKIMRLS